MDTMMSQGALSHRYYTTLIEYLPVDHRMKATMELADLPPRQKFEKLLKTLQELEHLSGMYSMNSGSFEAEHLPVSQRALVTQTEKQEKPKEKQIENQHENKQAELVKQLRDQKKKLEIVKPTEEQNQRGIRYQNPIGGGIRISLKKIQIRKRFWRG